MFLCRVEYQRQVEYLSHQHFKKKFKTSWNHFSYMWHQINAGFSILPNVYNMVGANTDNLVQSEDLLCFIACNLDYVSVLVGIRSS